MRKVLVLIVLWIGVVAVNAQTTNTGNIEGVITTPEGHPVPNVNVIIKGSKKHAVTDETGYFEFTNMPFGNYLLTYSFEGATSQEVPVTVPPVNSEGIRYNLPLKARELNEVIVRIGGSINKGTATVGKAGIPIMDLPQAVTVIGQQTIENQQAQRLSDVVKNVNGMYLGTTRGSTQEAFYARGYSLGSTNTFKNGFRLNSGTLPEMSALESVEILKGSAAILYGNVAPGAVINMITKKPKFYYGGEVSLRVGSYDLYKPSIDIFGPISKTVAFRLNGTYEKANSYRDNVHSERYYFNPSFLFKLGKKTELLVQGDYLHHDFTPDFGIGTMSTSSSVYGGKAIPNVSRSAFFGTPWQYSKTQQATASAELKHSFNEHWQFNTSVNYQNYQRDYFSIERVQLNSDGKYRRPLGKTNNKEDYYAAQANLNGNFTTGSLEHKLLIGADAEKYVQNNYTADINGKIYDSINIFDPTLYTRRADIPAAQWATRAHVPIERFGAYVQDLVKLSEKFKLLAGVRWSYQQADATKTDSLLKNTAAVGKIQIDKAFSPRVGLLYQPTTTTTVFASYANSFSPNTGTDIYNNAIKPSIIDQFELGVKNDLLEGRLSANLTLYRIVNNNLAQMALTDANGNPNSNSNIKELSGQTTSDGVEIDIRTQPVSGLDIMTGYSYNNMRYTKTSGKSGSYVEGQRLVNSPAHTANMTAFYTVQRGAVQGLKLGAGVYYTGDRNAGWNNTYTNNNGTVTDRLFAVKGFVTVDFTAGYTYKKWSLLAKLANLTNTYNYYVHENYSINPIPPRNFVITAAFKF
ncbi:MAG: TonB-dependent receptor [Niabella sp.]|nr:TonB-dependent receptor [Niabella sp.]